MKIAVVGCGALGSYYGARLCRAGHEVHFLLRSDYDVVRAQGVNVQSPDGDFHVRPFCARTPEEIGVCDGVLIGLKTTANGEFPRLLPPLAGPGTVVVSLQNGLGDEEQVASVLGAEPVLGGLCFVCLNRVEPGLIRHTAHGLVVLGEHLRAPGERVERLAGVLREAGIPCRVTPDLAQAHWEKLIWNIPFNGLGVAGAAGWEAVQEGKLVPGAEMGPVMSTDRLLADPRWEGLVRELMWEVIEGAAGQGYRLDPGLVDFQVERTRVMGAYRASTLVDWEEGRPMEVGSMFEEPRRRAASSGVHVPRLTALCEVLREMERRRVGGG